MTETQRQECIRLADTIIGAVRTMLDGSKDAVKLETLQEVATELRVRLITLERDTPNSLLKDAINDCIPKASEIRRTLTRNTVANLERALANARVIRSMLDELV